jgi:hypothetical protein
MKKFPFEMANDAFIGWPPNEGAVENQFRIPIARR